MTNGIITMGQKEVKILYISLIFISLYLTINPPNFLLLILQLLKILFDYWLPELISWLRHVKKAKDHCYQWVYLFF